MAPDRVKRRLFADGGDAVAPVAGRWRGRVGDFARGIGNRRGIETAQGDRGGNGGGNALDWRRLRAGACRDRWFRVKEGAANDGGGDTSNGKRLFGHFWYLVKNFDGYF